MEWWIKKNREWQLLFESHETEGDGEREVDRERERERESRQTWFNSIIYYSSTRVFDLASRPHSPTRSGSARSLKRWLSLHCSIILHEHMPASAHTHLRSHTLILWLKQLAALTKIECNIYTLTLRREKWNMFFSLLCFKSPFTESLPRVVFVVASWNSDAAPQFQGTLQAWHVAAAAISGENNCALKVDVTTSTFEALMVRGGYQQWK